MFKIVYRYFIINRKLNLPGVGVLAMQRQPASLDFSRKAFTPPSSRIEFTAGDPATEKKFLSFLSGEQNIEEAEAVNRFEFFVHQLSGNLQTKGRADLPGLGLLTRQEAGGIQFAPVLQVPEFFREVSIEQAVPAMADVPPTIIDSLPKEIGVSETVHEAVEESAAGKNYWWVYAIIIALLSIAAIVYYYTVNGSFQ